MVATPSIFFGGSMSAEVGDQPAPTPILYICTRGAVPSYFSFAFYTLLLLLLFLRLLGSPTRLSRLEAIKIIRREREALKSPPRDGERERS